MNYKEAMDYIGSIGARGIMPGMTRIECLLEETGHPEMACNVIHVAGTNGKGSVCTYIASVLRAAGYRVGRYVSPTLYDYRERIQINGQWMTEEETAEWMTVVKEADDRMQDRGIEGASAFELETVLAFLYFQNKECDFIVLETGMGGRLDATNVVLHPVVAVITSLGMDHMQYLGDTIEAIASEKGGIIKRGRPAVVCADNGKAADVLKDICSKQQAPCYPVYSDHVVIRQSSLEQGQYFDYGDYRDLRTGMLGSYQPGNAAVAIEAIKVLIHLSAKDFPAAVKYLPSERLNPQLIRQGIRQAVWPGRFEVVSDDPLIIVDGAHNPDGAKALKASVCQYLKGRRIILVMGVFADKDYRQMVKIVSELSDTLITFRPAQDRGLDAAKLAEAAAPCFRYIQTAESQREAVDRALSLCGTEDVILSFGSLSTVGELKHIIRRIRDEKN